MTVSNPKFLLLYRHPAAAAAHQPSPAEMQQMLSQWTQWKQRFQNEIIDLGDGLKPDGKLVRAEGVTTDGPFVEAKEVMGGYSIVQAASLARAAEISRSCPVLMIPGASVEVRELAGY
jgi:hypothetical protein